MSFLSVIIPTYNGEQVIRRALDSVLAEDDHDLEILVIDDGSSDDTMAIVESYTDCLPIHLIVRERDCSWVRGTNIGLENARSDYVCFLHQDDFWLPGRIRTLRRMAHDYPEAVVLLHPSIFVDSAGRYCGTWHCPFGNRERVVSKSEVLDHLVIQNFVSIPAPAVRRGTMLKAAPLDDSLWFTADWKFWLGLDGPWAYCPEPYSAFRVHTGSQTARDTKRSAVLRDQLDRASAALLPLVSPRIRRAARFNLELNVLLAARFHHESCGFADVLRAGVAAGPLGVWRSIHSSRLVERTVSRIRAGLR